MVFFIVNFRAKGFCSRIKNKDSTPDYMRVADRKKKLCSNYDYIRSKISYNWL